jgi:predicted DNA binding CopG/RHH family protein
MSNTPPSGPYNNNDTPKQQNVKVVVKADGLQRIRLEMRLQGQIVNAIEDCLNARGETMQQYLKDLLEKDLMKEGYLPDWWHTRGTGII